MPDNLKSSMRLDRVVCGLDPIKSNRGGFILRWTKSNDPVVKSELYGGIGWIFFSRPDSRLPSFHKWNDLFLPNIN